MPRAATSGPRRHAGPSSHGARRTLDQASDAPRHGRWRTGPMPPTRTLSEADSASLAGYGVPVVSRSGPPTPTRRPPRRIGFPVAVTLRAAIAQTERGLVRLDWRRRWVRGAAVELLGAARPEDGEVELLVAPMVRGVRELIAGLHRDEQFGMAVMLGVGGVLAEAIADVSFRLVPIERADAEEMIDDLSTRQLFEAFRGSPRSTGIAWSTCSAGFRLGRGPSRDRLGGREPAHRGRGRAAGGRRARRARGDVSAPAAFGGGPLGPSDADGRSLPSTVRAPGRDRGGGVHPPGEVRVRGVAQHPRAGFGGRCSPPTGTARRCSECSPPPT